MVYSGLCFSLFEYLIQFTESFNTVNLINMSCNMFYEPTNSIAVFFDDDTFTMQQLNITIFQMIYLGSLATNTVCNHTMVLDEDFQNAYKRC